MILLRIVGGPHRTLRVLKALGASELLVYRWYDGTPMVTVTMILQSSILGIICVIVIFTTIGRIGDEDCHDDDMVKSTMFLMEIVRIMA